MTRRLLLAALPLATLLLGARGFAQDRVRIVVFRLFHPTQITVEALPGSPLRLRVAGQEVVLGDGQTQQAGFRIASDATSIIFGETQMAASPILVEAATSGDTDFLLIVPGKIRRRFHGTLILARNAREMLPLVELDAELAVASIVAAEMPIDAPLEALKAQAVVSRSFLLANRARHVFADSCDTTHCQFLRGPPAPGSPAAQAAATTRGLVLTWHNAPFAAMYSRSCGGRTHSLADLGLTARDYPYFSVECRHCLHSPERWTSAVALQDAAALRRNPGERERLEVARQYGWNSVASNTWSTQSEDGSAVILEGLGHGHGIGLCQLGAAAMARDGADFLSILAYYFPNAVVRALAH